MSNEFKIVKTLKYIKYEKTFIDVIDVCVIDSTWRNFY